MPDSVLLPALGESVTEGTVTRWLKAVGELVAIDEPLVEVSTDKVDTEIPSPFAGILQSIEVAEDQIAEIGAVLAIIGAESAAPVVEAPAPVVTPPSDRDSLGRGPESEGPAASLRAAGALGDFPANRPQAAATSLPSCGGSPASTRLTWQPWRAPASVDGSAETMSGRQLLQLLQRRRRLLCPLRPPPRLLPRHRPHFGEQW